MRKGFILLLLILFSCQKDEILVIDQILTYTMIFEKDGIVVEDGQDISFEVLSTTQHQLIISTQDGSVLSKESFIPTLGLNTRKIYTKTLPKERLQLILVNGVETIKKTFIIIN